MNPAGRMETRAAKDKEKAPSIGALVAACLDPTTAD